MKAREAVVQNYIEGYNQFDIEKMTRDFDVEIEFRNIRAEVISMELHGIAAFKEQALAATEYFTERTQTVNSIKHENGAVEFEIAYRGIAAQDLPGGLKKGEELHLTGTSVFTFNKDNRVISLTDIS